ncbi:MAG TPA: TRAP transporter TatT component family protein [Oceanipulchritudo sp.]|nr:TRAP transporter TatT component family protein [Oceanipulchritudo sp.]
MSSRNQYMALFGCCLLAGILTGCASTKQAVETNTAKTSSVIHVDIPFADLQPLEDSARSRPEIEQVLAGYEQISVQDPAYNDAQIGIARLYLLLGAAHALDRSEQREFYTLAQQAAERALRQNAAFRQTIDSGQSFATAAQALPVEDYEPLFLWVTSVFYTFRDVARLPERTFKRKNLQEAAAILENMIRTAPAWNDGALQFSLGIYYLSVPQFMGGNRSKARQLMNEAVEMSDQRLLARWGRAKYLAVELGDWELFHSDLEWVATRDLSALSGPVIWNAYFQEDALRLLESRE